MFSSPLILTSLIAFIVIAVLNGFQFKIPYSEFRPQFLCDKRIVNWAFIIKKGNLSTNITWYPLFSRLLKKETKTASCRQTFKRFCYHHVFHLHLKKVLTYVTSILLWFVFYEGTQCMSYFVIKYWSQPCLRFSQG